MKTEEQIVDNILTVLSKNMNHPYISKFHTYANIIEDLAIDSVLFLQLITFLELEHGLEMPEQALMKDKFETVMDVVEVLYTAQEGAKVEKGLGDYEDLKVHCVASCLSEIVKRHDFLDYRILFFAVWDAEICISDDYILTYHSENITHDFFMEWFEKIYGMEVKQWYDHNASKANNIAELIRLVEKRSLNQHIMVMLDMFHIPEMLNEFNKDPFPHYVMLGPTVDPELWMVYDPDYVWEGVISKEKIINAVNQPTVGGGYLISDANVRPTPKETIRDYIEACVYWNHNPITDAIRSIIKAHLSGYDKNNQPLSINKLDKALEELPVIQPRKYMYKYAFEFFWQELALPKAEYEQLCIDVNDFTKAYKIIHLQVMKLAASGNHAFAEKAFQLLDQQDEREFYLKRQLQQAYQQWLDKEILQSTPLKVVEV